MSSVRKIAPLHNKLSLSIIIPAFNEEGTIETLLHRILETPLSRAWEIIIVDDGSTDKTGEICARFIESHPQFSIHYLCQKNQGKGGAVKRGLERVKHDIVLIQDADLEYDPKEYPFLLAPIDNGAQVVYGSRNMTQNKRPHSSLLYYIGGLLVTWITNLLFQSHLTDEATGYKVFRTEVLRTTYFSQKDFSWEPEVTARILKKKISIAEVPISYSPRSFHEGKKITWFDGIKAIWILLNERLKK